MLIQYSVSNYKSIRDEIIINFTAGKKYEDSKWTVKDGYMKDGLYKAIGLVGPNASGKSNIINSLVFALRFITSTVSRKENSKINVDCFRLDLKSADEPSAFEFIFYHNGIKYIYGFSVTKDKVIEEYLMGYYTAKPKTIFDRDINRDPVFKFYGNDEKTQKVISQKTSGNRLYMPVAAEFQYAPCSTAYNWFTHITRQYDGKTLIDIVADVIENSQLKTMLLEELKKADFNIVDIYLEERKLDDSFKSFVSKFLSELSEDTSDIALPDSRPEIRVVHKGVSGSTLDILLDNDSAGTQEIIEYLAELLLLSKEGGFIIEDELGKVFHTKLSQHYLDMIRRLSFDGGNMQLLFSSHDPKILNILHPDQVYLVDKDETGNTYVTLLDDYEMNNSENIELGYLKGRFGSVPHMRS